MTSEALVEATSIDDYVEIYKQAFGSAVDSSIIVKVSDSITSIRVQGNTTGSWTSTPYDETITTKYDGYFIIPLPNGFGYQYWKITAVGSGDMFFNWLYFGANIVFPDLNIGSFPEIVKENITNETSGGQVYTTAGVAHYEQEIGFSNILKTDYQVFEDWYISIASSYNQLFYQYDERLDEYKPYYCSVLELQPTARSKDYYDFKIIIREAK
jgi:hypothetical protein